MFILNSSSSIFFIQHLGYFHGKNNKKNNKQVILHTIFYINIW